MLLVRHLSVSRRVNVRRSSYRSLSIHWDPVVLLSMECSNNKILIFLYHHSLPPRWFLGHSSQTDMDKHI